VNLALPSTLGGSGQVNVFLLIDGQPTNIVQIDIG